MKKYFIKIEPKIPFTKSGYEKVLQEKQDLINERPDAVDHLKKARDMGDLSENGYYRAAKSRLITIDAQLRKVDRLIKLGVVVEAKGTNSVDIGNTVELDDGEKHITYTIVGGFESDPTHHTISHLSPIGKAIMHKKVGESVNVQVPIGIKKYTILSIT